MTSEAEKRSALKLALKIVSDKRNEERYCFSSLVDMVTLKRFDYYDMRRVLEDMLHSTPSVETVSVVRCGECERCNTIFCPMRKAEVRYPIKDDGFCCYGERKKEDNETD